MPLSSAVVYVCHYLNSSMVYRCFARGVQARIGRVPVPSFACAGLRYYRRIKKVEQAKYPSHGCLGPATEASAAGLCNIGYTACDQRSRHKQVLCLAEYELPLDLECEILVKYKLPLACLHMVP